MGGYPDSSDEEGPSPLPMGTPVYSGQSGDWEHAQFDLTRFAGKVIRLRLRAALPDKPIAVLEAGWATVATEFGERANEADQARHFRELREWAAANNTTVFWFEAFDETWKGLSDEPLAAEKHWGLFDVKRRPKLAMK